MIKLFSATISLLLAGSFSFSGAAQPALGRSAQAWESVLFTLLSPAGKREVELSSYKEKRGWATAEEDILALCKENAREAKDAEVHFDAEGFHFTPEENGVYCDYALSLENALNAVAEGKTECELVTAEYAPKITLRTLKERTLPLSAFTTYFDAANAPRAHNIALAASKITGTTLAPNAEFSFNETVGKRTEENGFEIASVIFGGEFVPGVGGGVCQASTTLMNAALHSGMKITESHPHSLSVGYVPPSLDAMVSEYSDLKFVNPYPFPVYLAACTGENFVRFTFYGKPSGKRFETQSCVRYHIAPPPAQIVEGEEEKVIRAEKEGLSSESYLLTYEGGTRVSRTRLRRDTYSSMQGIYQIAAQSGEEGEEIIPEKNSENP